MDSSIKHQTINGVLWRIVETGGTQIIQFVISVVLARLIMPEQFAEIAMLSIFMAIASVFINSGFSSALIRKIDRTQADCDTVFYFNIVVSIISYCILYFIAPLVAQFYEIPELKTILRISSLSLVIGSLAGVHRTLIQARMEFKKLAKYNVLALAISGSIGIYLAYRDFQVWALVIQSLVSVSISTIFIFYGSTWRPKMQFSWDSLKEFFNFGSKLLGSSLIDTTYKNIYSVVIGKFFPHSDLAFYNRANSLKGLSSAFPMSVVQSVTYPALCKLQSNDELLRSSYRKLIQVGAFIIFPLCLGLGAVSYPLINVLYTNVWIYSASLLEIIVFAGMWYPIHAINLNLLQVKGRSDLFFRLEIVQKIIGVIILCVTLPFGLKALCYGEILLSILCLIVNTHYTSKLLNLGFIEQMKDICPSLILSCVMFIVCKMLSTIMGNDIISLITSVGAGIAIYGSVSYLLKFKELKLIKELRS